MKKQAVRFGREQRGAMTIVEAAFVFPITFFIVFFMIMAGEAYYQHARVEYYVTSAAINAAAKCETPFLTTVMEKNEVPTDPSKMDILPYRYIFTGEAKKITSTAEGDLLERVENMKPLLFKNMRPTDVSVSIKPHLNPLVSHIEASCEFSVPFPIRMLFSDEDISWSYYVHVSAAAGDPAEFIRNVSLVTDILERSEKFTEFCGKTKEYLSKIGGILG